VTALRPHGDLGWVVHFFPHTSKSAKESEVWSALYQHDHLRRTPVSCIRLSSCSSILCYRLYYSLRGPSARVPYSSPSYSMGNEIVVPGPQNMMKIPSTMHGGDHFGRTSHHKSLFLPPAAPRCFRNHELCCLKSDAGALGDCLV
jgi:hypothetical protein